MECVCVWQVEVEMTVPYQHVLSNVYMGPVKRDYVTVKRDGQVMTVPLRSVLITAMIMECVI